MSNDSPTDAVNRILHVVEAMGADMAERLADALTTASTDTSRCVVAASVPIDMADFVVRAMQCLEEDDGSSIIMVLRRDVYDRLTAGESLTLAELTVHNGPAEST